MMSASFNHTEKKIKALKFLKTVRNYNWKDKTFHLSYTSMLSWHKIKYSEAHEQVEI